MVGAASQPSMLFMPLALYMLRYATTHDIVELSRFMRRCLLSRYKAAYSATARFVCHAMRRDEP